MTTLVRPESRLDRLGIRRLHRRAFGGEEEAGLVDALREGHFCRVSLVVELADEIVGHILFSDLKILAGGRVVNALALAPMAVLPEHQRQKIGSVLVRRGLDACRAEGHRIVIVLGHPGYYPRFGFSPELARKLIAP